MTGDGSEDFETAFAELFLAAYRVALRILGNTGEAEDVAAEALARALRSWDRVADLPYRNAWVVRVAANLPSTPPAAAGRLRRSRTTFPTWPRPSRCAWPWAPPSAGSPGASARSSPSGTWAG